MMTSPPRPPSPPLGPPRGTYFSRRNATQPLPPSPAFTVMIASSINTGNSRDTKARNDPENGVRIRPWLGKLLRCADADELAHAPAIAELDDAAYLGEQRVVFADT